VNVAELELLLSEPTAPLVDAMRQLSGDILLLGVAGKMGPTLARLARRATDATGVQRRIIGVARFADPAVRASLEREGIETITCDLLDAAARRALPATANVISLVGQKFGTTGQEPRTWAVNAWLAGTLAEQFQSARFVALSTGNVYPLWPRESAGPTESDPVGPIGEYAQSALARERLLTFFSERLDVAMAILRLNYAIEPRYGVLRDIADAIWQGRPVALGMGTVNVIWQRDANAMVLMALAHCGVPPIILNVTGAAVSVRALAEGLGRRLARAPIFSGEEAPTALLSNAARATALFGAPPVGIERMLDVVAEWVAADGASLGKPTHFEERSGAF
jgi:nucleoside-diphosphate-sugar epimerase